MTTAKVILYSLLTHFVLLTIMFIIDRIITIKSISRREEEIRILDNSIKPGKYVLFAGGLIGKIKKVDGDIIIIETENSLVRVSRFSIIRDIDVD